MKASEEVAWLAGLFDGEGTITTNVTRKKGRASISFHLKAAIKMVTGPWIEPVSKILKKHGINACVNKGEKKRILRGHQEVTIISIWDINAKKLAQLLMPCLVVKKEAAKTVLDFERPGATITRKSVSPFVFRRVIHWDRVLAWIELRERLNTIYHSHPRKWTRKAILDHYAQVEGTTFTTDTGIHFPISVEEVKKLYWDDDLTLKEIGDRIDRSNQSVYRFMKRNNIPRR